MSAAGPHCGGGAGGGGGGGGGAGGGGAGGRGGSGPRHGWSRDAGVVLRAVGPRPGLWWASVGALRRMARRGWWHRAPFLPLPGDDYWRFRLVTAYGGDGQNGELTPEDVLAYVRWCQRSRPGRG